MTPPIVRDATRADARAICAIYNAGIAGRGATFETTPRTVADLETRIDDVDRFPLVVADAGAAGIVGWAGLSAYRPRACYSGIAEFSVYVAPDWHRRGTGRVLMEGLIASAEDAGYWKLVSRVFTFNEGSRALCRAVGFREVGVYERHGYLDGEWRDVVVVERLIPANQTTGGLRFRRAQADDWTSVEALLLDASLPRDGAREHLSDFIVAVDQDRIVGAAGIERYGETALLRSVVLTPVARGRGAGRILVDRVLSRAARNRAREVFLLTTTAATFFERLGFVGIARGDVPREALASAEFRGACPETAVVMRKSLGSGK